MSAVEPKCAESASGTPIAWQMVFISAGFDAHRDDDLGQLRLNEHDFAWITERVRGVAQRHAQGRIVSMLEGGYNLDALATSVEAHIRVLADL